MDIDHRLPGTVLVDLYIRLRDEVDRGEMNLDPNHKLRSGIAMAVLNLAERYAEITALEAQVRMMLSQTPQPQAA